MKALLDATVLSNFSHVHRPDLVRLAVGPDAASTPLVWAEIEAGIRLGKLPACDWSWLPILTLSDDEASLFEGFCQSVNRGEASCLAVAHRRGYRVLTDDRDARELAARWGIPISGTLGLLVRLLDLGLLSLDQGDGILGRMIAAGYRAPIQSLGVLRG